MSKSTIDLEEVEKFSRIADEWWNKNGKFKPLHKFNPIRVNFIKNEINNYFGKIEDLEIIDIGCGGGLVSEEFAKLQAIVTGIDASEKNIKVAKIHADKSNLKINYIATSTEELVKEDKKFDVILALEVIEHVADVEEFIKNCSNLVRPNGLVFFATINRTIKSLATAKIAVEYILRWLPAGTHDWNKFLKPFEIANFANQNNLSLQKQCGFNYNIFKDFWSETTNLDVNYISLFKKQS